MLWVQTLTKWQNKNEISINPVPPINIIINGTNFHSFNSLIVSLKGWWCGPKASSGQDNYWQFQLSEFPINLIEPVSHIIYYVEQNLIHHKIVRIYCLNIALQDLYSSPPSTRKITLSKFEDTLPYGTNISGESSNKYGCMAIPHVL